jgi:hypothetical protein
MYRGVGVTIVAGTCRFTPPGSALAGKVEVCGTSVVVFFEPDSLPVWLAPVWLAPVWLAPVLLSAAAAVFRFVEIGVSGLAFPDDCADGEGVADGDAASIC